jgi:hypothetical protein
MCKKNNWFSIDMENILYQSLKSHSHKKKIGNKMAGAFMYKSKRNQS